MKTAIVGCGALGSYYGGKLARMYPDVHFLLRSDYETVKNHGLTIESVDGSFHVSPHCACRPEEIGPVDLVLIGLKTTANHQFKALLPPLMASSTSIVTLQNGLGNEESLAALFGPHNILGGLCFICVQRVAPGHIRHSAYGRIVLGEFQRASQSRTHTIAAFLRAAGIPCDVSDNLARAHWEKLVWNIPFNGLGVAGVAGFDAVATGQAKHGPMTKDTLATDQLLAQPRWEQLVRELMNEVVTTARALGHDLDSSVIETNINRTRSMGAYKASTLLDFERGQPIELENLFLFPLRCAQKAGVETPRLKALCSILDRLCAQT